MRLQFVVAVCVCCICSVCFMRVCCCAASTRVMRHCCDAGSFPTRCKEPEALERINIDTLGLLPVAELKAILQKRAVPYHDCVEKSELVARVGDCAAAEAASSRVGMLCRLIKAQHDAAWHQLNAPGVPRHILEDRWQTQPIET